MGERRWIQKGGGWDSGGGSECDNEGLCGRGSLLIKIIKSFFLDFE